MQTRLNRRDLLVGAGAAAGVARFATPSRRSLARRNEPITLTWLDGYAGSPANNAAMEAQLQAYMDANPNVTIEREAIAFDTLKTVILERAEKGTLPDVVSFDNPDHQAFASMGILADLTEHVTAWGQADAYFPGHWSSTIWQGNNYGVPDNSSCLALWYNTELLTAAEIEPPTNWAELTAAATALTEGDQYGLAVSADRSEQGTFQWLPFLWETGEDIATIDSEGGRRALQLWVDYVADGLMSKEVLTWDQGELGGQFGEGKAAMMVNGPWMIPGITSTYPDLKWDIVTLPPDQVAASILGGENYAVSATSKHVDAAAAWDLLAFTQTPDILKAYLIEAGKLPARQDLAEDAAWTDDPILKAFLEQLKVARPRAYGANYPEISVAIQEAMQTAISGEVDVATALKTAQTTITPLLPPS
jgi:multiple sugar transport system substrate-binding protein